MTKARDLANGGFGLVLIKPSSVVNGTDNGKGTVSFSGASTVSLNDVFSATYDTYKVIINWTSATAQNLGMRLRVSGADNSTAGNYMWGENGLTFSGGSSLNNNSSDTSWNMEYTDTNGAVMAMDIYDPFSSTKITRFNGLSTTRLSTAAASFYRGHGGNMTVTTSYTGFTIFVSSGTITGSVSVYGYNE